MEIIVVDNHSNDDSAGVFDHQLKRLGIKIIETSANKGFGKGYNYGASYACGRYLLFNNPDKMLQKNGLELLVKRLEEDASVGIIAPKLLHHDGTRRLSIRAFPRWFDIVIKRTLLSKIFRNRIKHYLQMQRDPQKECLVDWVIGGCFLIRRGDFEALGGFDRRFFLFFEDTDLCRRCWKAGKSVLYYPTAVAYDKKRRLSEGGIISLFATKIGRSHLASALKYFWKWHHIKA